MKFHLVILCSLFIFLSGCTRYIRWAQRIFKQAPQYHNNLLKARHFIRSSYIYDQFNTVSLFDVLWLSKTVHMTYIDLYAHHWNLSLNSIQNLRKQHLQEFEHTIAFYILLAPDDEDNTLGMINLETRWAVVLKINNKIYYPRDIRLEDELSPEYKVIFGDLDSIHKRVYFVTFDAFDKDKRPLIDSSSTIELKMHSTIYETSVCWETHEI
jgi:hypothetical protein